MSKKDEFISIFTEKVQREGADKLLEFLSSDSSDFFTAPASARFHGSYEGGLLDHSLNVYFCLSDYLKRDTVKNLYGLNFSDESIAISALLHDLCKINCYEKGTRNIKDKSGAWKSIPTYDFNDILPYGHGEKSVYIISGYMKLTRDEAFAIRYHMGFSSIEEPRVVGQVFEKYPLAFALSTADMEATYFLEGSVK